MYSQINSLFRSIAAMGMLMTISLTSFSQENRFSISINSLNTNFNYGSLNKAFQPYKKEFKGLQIGASYQAGISPMFSVVPEVYFAMKGGTLKQDNPITINKSTTRLYTAELPVLARLHLNHFYLNTGPYATYTFGGRIKMDGSKDLPSSSTKVSFGSSAGDFKRWDLGFQAGVGYNFKIKSTPLTLDARYGYGLVNISNDIKRYNRMLNISLVVSSPSKKSQDRKPR
jgi:hypothetical protein